MTILLLLTGTGSLWGQVKETRVDKTFNVNSSTRLNIHNRFGKVHVDTWEQNKIEAKITIEVDGGDAAARSILERINIDVSESSSEIRIETEISESRNKFRNEKFTIDYMLKMPKNNPLTINHRHGDIYLDNLSGPLDIELAHGQIVAEELVGKARISLQHGNGGRIAAIGSGSLDIQHYQRLRLGSLGSMELEIAHASLEVGDAGDLDLEIRHSNVEFGNAGAVNLDMQHSKMEAESLQSLRADLQHSTIEMEKLDRFIDADCNHSHIAIDRMAKSFTSITYEGNHSYLGVDLEPGAKADLEVDLEHGRLDYSESDIDMSYINNENNQRRYKGKIGGGGGGQIQIEGNFTDVSIGVN